MNIRDSVSTLCVCSSVCSELHELPVCRTEPPVTTAASSIFWQRRPSGCLKQSIPRRLRVSQGPETQCLSRCCHNTGIAGKMRSLHTRKVPRANNNKQKLQPVFSTARPPLCRSLATWLRPAHSNLMLAAVHRDAFS